MNTEFSFRETTKEDVTYIKRLNYLTEVFGNEDITPDIESFVEGKRFYLDKWVPEGGGIIAFDRVLDNPAGATWITFGSSELHGEGFISHDVPELAIAVEARYRGRGLAGCLLRETIDLARRQGCPAISLCVHEDNPKARAVYAHEGFTTVRFNEFSRYETMVYQF